MAATHLRAGQCKARRRLDWFPLVAGLLALYLPTLIDLLGGIWGSDEQKHGPIVLLIAVWLFYRQWPAMWQRCAGQQPSAAGWPLVMLALLLYSLGRSQDVLLFEVGSVIPLLAGILLLNLGRTALRAQWFALFFMLFMLPLPAFVVDTITMPMKMAVSYVAEQLLFLLGYPIARSGVILQIGQYKLLVANACAGLHTLFTLEALGLLYLNIVRHDSLMRNVALAILIIPISFAANVFRVSVLALITYHFGDAAGQGFLHMFAGMVLFLSALLLIISVDTLLQQAAKHWPARGTA